MKTLLVEDDSGIQAMVAEVLSSRGHDVTACDAAEKAWTIAQDETFPLIVLNWLLPVMDGLELCRRIRSLDHGRDSVVLVMAGGVRTRGLTAALNAGANDFLAKPFDIDLLETRLAIAEQQVEAITARRSLENEARVCAAVIEQMPSGVIVLDAAGLVSMINEAGRRILGTPPDVSRPLAEQAIDLGIRGHHGDHPQAPHETAAARVLAGETIQHVETVVQRPGSTEKRWLLTSGVPLRDSSGDVAGGVIVFSDMTQEKMLLRTLTASEERLRMVYEAIACGILIQDPAGRLVHANAAAEEVLGRTLEQMRGQRAQALWQTVGEDGLPLPSAEDPAEVASRTGQPVHHVTVRAPRPDGEVRWLQVDAVPVQDVEGGPLQIVLSFIDISPRLRAEEALRHQAAHDVLTGLPNRALFDDRLAQALLAAQRQTTPLALLLIDLDRFKTVNDTRGHHVGDLLLQEVARRVHESLRASDTVARLGGDEFAVLLPTDTDSPSALTAARKILSALEQPLIIEGLVLDITASIGVALYPEHGADGATLLRHADVAMYAAKMTSTGFAFYAQEQEQDSPTRLALVGELRAATEGEQILLQYQPQVEVATGRLRGVEALARWRHPERGLIAPDEFIPLAEHTGLISALVLWTLDAALQQCRRWQDEGLSLGVAVNLSTRNLQNPALPEQVASSLARHGVAAASLTLEITESTLMADPARALEVLRGLAALGVRVSIDDFGTGYSSLAYLKRLPVDEIKIDTSFVIGMLTDDADAAIVRTILTLGHSLGLTVVAEGVETGQAWELVSALGCEITQGYYLGHPLLATDVLPWASGNQARLAGLAART